MGQLGVRTLFLVGIVALLAGCASEPTVGAGTPTAGSASNLNAMGKPVDNMPPQAKAAMEAGGGKAPGGL